MIPQAWSILEGDERFIRLTFIYKHRELDVWEPMGFDAQAEYDRAEVIETELSVEEEWFIAHEDGTLLHANYEPRHGERFAIRPRYPEIASGFKPLGHKLDF
jgi:hypothetical protein